MVVVWAGQRVGELGVGQGRDCCAQEVRGELAGQPE
jgi:hypothetical protein